MAHQGGSSGYNVQAPTDDPTVGHVDEDEANLAEIEQEMAMHGGSYAYNAEYPMYDGQGQHGTAGQQGYYYYDQYDPTGAHANPPAVPDDDDAHILAELDAELSSPVHHDEYNPVGANGGLSKHAAEFWYPESRNCTCCKGYKHGCGCVKDGVRVCQEKACTAPAAPTEPAASK